MSQSEQASLNTTSNGPVLPLLLTIPAVAAKLGVSRPTVYTLIYTKGLPSIKLGRNRRVSAASLERWLQEREQSA